MISDIRRDYYKEGFTREHLTENPIDLFKQWFQDAVEYETFDPNAMSLATVNNLGFPSCRIVLLKEISQDGFTFFTNYESRKGQEMESNNRVSASFYWPKTERQIRIRGYVERISKEKSDEYFLSRPIDSQISALVSPQSKVIDDLELLKSEAKKIKESNQSLQRPESWGGYIIMPIKIEYWQGGVNRIHTRFEYYLEEDVWEIRQLAP